MNFLPGWFSGGGTGIPDAIATFISSHSDTANIQVYTFAVNLGAVGDYEHFVLCCGEDIVTTSVTLDGVAATRLIDGTNKLSIFIVPYTAGGTKNVVVTYGSNRTRGTLEVYGIKGLLSMTPVDTLADDTHAANVLTDTINVAAGGCVIVLSNMNGSSSATGVGVTERVDKVVESNVTIWSGESNHPTAQTPLTVTITWANAPQDLIGVSLR